MYGCGRQPKGRIVKLWTGFGTFAREDQDDGPFHNKQEKKKANGRMDGGGKQKQWGQKGTTDERLSTTGCLQRWDMYIER